MELQKQQMLEVLFSAVHIAGEEILKIYNKDFDVSYKEDQSPLTQADRVSHNVIKNKLEVFNFPFLSEEGIIPDFAARKGWEKFWLVDPLDGTKEFINRNGEFTINIALIHDQTPVLGIIYAPVLDLCYYADEHQGSFRVDHFSDYFNGKASNEIVSNSIRLPVKRKDETIVVVASRSHMNSETQEFIKKAEQENEKVTFVSRGSSLKLCMIAEGSADIYPRFGRTMEWDIAAGHAIIKYAGKEVKEVSNGRPLIYNKENLSNPFFIAR